eukprot:1146605-Pelagomonas_calceolata.AAC.2
MQWFCVTSASATAQLNGYHTLACQGPVDKIASTCLAAKAPHFGTQRLHSQAWLLKKASP